MHGVNTNDPLAALIARLEGILIIGELPWLYLPLKKLLS
jgi:hypothetical protein